MDIDTIMKEFKTIAAYGKAERINDICEMIERYKKATHEDDDKNCHSCKYCKGFKEEESEQPDVGYGEWSISELYPICEKDYGDHSARDLSIMGYKLNCIGYEWCGGRWVDYRNKLNLDNDEAIEIPF